MIQDVFDGCMAMMATLTFLTAQAMSGKVVHISPTMLASMGTA